MTSSLAFAVHLEFFGAEQFQYVVGARLKQLKKVDQDALLAWRPETAGIGELTVGKHLVLSYSPKRAAHDAKQHRAMSTEIK